MKILRLNWSNKQEATDKDNFEEVEDLKKDNKKTEIK